MLTLEEVKNALPVHLKTAATPHLVDMLNNIPLDPEIADTIRNNFVSYSIVLKDGKFKMEDYLNAVAYVSFKVMGYSNQESYSRTFPQRYAELVAKGTSGKDISSYVAAYNKNKLVNLIYEQTVIPTWLLNQDVYQKAINVQLDIMTSAKSEMVRMQAANSLLTHLKRPETKEVNVNLGVTETSGMKELTDLMTQLAEKQIKSIEGGTATRDIAHQMLTIDGTAEEM